MEIELRTIISWSELSYGKLGKRIFGGAVWR